MGELSPKSVEGVQHMALVNSGNAQENSGVVKGDVIPSQSLRSLEEVQSGAYETFYTAQSAYVEAQNQTEAARKAYDAAEMDYMNGKISAKEWQAARQELTDAKAAEKSAKKEYESAASNAQAAAEAVEKKKQELRDSRKEDTTYVVHCARIECPFGMRESYLALGETHGVMTHQIPQMTVEDMVLNHNIINFGGCHSRENPGVKEQIEKTNAIIEAKKDWRDKLIGLFTKPAKALVAAVEGGVKGTIGAVKSTIEFVETMVGVREKGLSDGKKSEEEIEKEEKEKEEEKLKSLRSDFVGECIAEFPANGEWLEGHEKVFINGKQVLLRRCSIMCNYGGCVTILLSGQPE